MIFGIKTKKDKKIEELQKEIERLRAIPHFFCDNRKVLTYRAKIVIPLNKSEILEDYAIRELAKKMEDAVKSNLEIEYRDDPITSSRYYLATLNIVEGRN